MRSLGWSFWRCLVTVFYRGIPSKTFSTNVPWRYTNLSEKNGAFSRSRRKKILSPSHKFRSSILAIGNHSSVPSSQAVSSPVKFVAVYRHIYSAGSSSERKVTIPLKRYSVSVRPVSSFTSRKRQSSGLSPASKCPPTPIHLSWLMSFFLVTRCSIR